MTGETTQSLIDPKIEQGFSDLKTGMGMLGTVGALFSTAWDMVWNVAIIGGLGYLAYKFIPGAKDFMDKGMDWFANTSIGGSTIEMFSGLIDKICNLFGIENPLKDYIANAADNLTPEQFAEKIGDTQIANVLYNERGKIARMGILSLDSALSKDNLKSLILALDEDTSKKLIDVLATRQGTGTPEQKALADKAMASFREILKDPAVATQLMNERGNVISYASTKLMGVPADVLKTMQDTVGLQSADYYLNLLKTNPQQAIAELAGDEKKAQLLKKLVATLPSMDPSLLSPELAANKDRIAALANDILDNPEKRAAVATLASKGVLFNLAPLAADFKIENALTAFSSAEVREAIKDPLVVKAMGALIPDQVANTALGKIVQFQSQQVDGTRQYTNLQAVANLSAYLADDSKVTPEQRTAITGFVSGYINNGGTVTLPDSKVTAEFFSGKGNQKAFIDFMNTIELKPIEGTPAAKAIAEIKNNPQGLLNILSDEKSIEWLKGPGKQLASQADAAKKTADGSWTDLNAWKAWGTNLVAGVMPTTELLKSQGAPDVLVQNAAIVDALKPFFEAKPTRTSALTDQEINAVAASFKTAGVEGGVKVNAAPAPILASVQTEKAIAVGATA